MLQKEKNPPLFARRFEGSRMKLHCATFIRIVGKLCLIVLLLFIFLFRSFHLSAALLLNTEVYAKLHAFVRDGFDEAND